MIIETSLLPRGADALCAWPFILVRPTSRKDKALIEHELVHFREQAWITLAWWALYLISARFRQAAEVRAYREQMRLGGISRTQAALQLMKYRLSITYDQAYELMGSQP